MKEYDFVFSMGFSCGTSQALRAAGLQYASYPLDWVAIRSIDAGVAAIEVDFARFIEADDMKLYDVRHGAGFMTRAYVNVHTDMGFSHEFSDFRPFAEVYPTVRASYEKRAGRFMRDIAKADRILAVWVEVPLYLDPDVAVYRDALRRLRAKFAGKQVDLIAFRECPGCGEPRELLEEDGLTVVAADYRRMEGRAVSHYVDFSQYVRYLKPRVRMPDPRTEEEKAKYAATANKIASYRWGPDKSRFRRWLNHHAYKTCRSLEKILQRKGIVQEEGLFWFWDEQTRLAEGGAE